jgi:hypothetical protein
MAIPVREEQEWARRYPVPNAKEEDILLSLWNYPVAKTDLLPEHRASLKKFLSGDFLQVQLTRTTQSVLYVRGHASDSGEAPANIALSRDRAQKVMRFLVSEGIPASQIHVEWAGASEPADTGASGYAAARNRRVDVVRFVPPVPEDLPPIGTDPPPPAPEPPPEPGFKIPKGAQPSSLTIDIPLDIPLPPIRTAEVLIDGKIGGVLKLKVDDKGGGWGGGLAINNGKLTAKFETKIMDDLKAKINFEPKSAGKDAALKVGGEVKIGTLDTTVGLQTKLPNFVYCEFAFEAFRLPDIELGDVHVSMTMKPTLKIDVGPGPALLARIGVGAGGAAGIVAGTVVFSALLIVGTAKTVEYAKEESIRYTKLLARRSGVAARVAYEIVGNQAEVRFREQQLQWTNTLDRMGPSFDEGVALVNAQLRKGDREKLRNDWTAKYAAGSQDFGDIQERVFGAIGKYEKGDDAEDPTSRL